ncbi:uncharacterized protein LOC113859544 [Abrus precatorius]|uniref:Uncharacterized protein LOC113859544 n=1 Tax=Abrus precatorius TaxID=3816 RepID=A0A8B8L0C7_ABRPR|nr:uncharacterized protein LOC113859544 [Abrus precatorius]
MEKIFNAIGCHEEHKVVYATYMLAREVEDWWKFASQTLPQEDGYISWEAFKANSKGKTVDTRVRGSVRQDLRLPRFQRGPYPRVSQFQSRESVSCGSSSGGSNALRDPIKCFRCGGPHIVRNYPQPPSACSICERMGHSANTRWFAPQRNESANGSNKPLSRGSSEFKPTTQGKVFAMSGAEATKSDELIRGKCVINERLLDVLFNSGATHSFISMDYMKYLGLAVSSMPYNVVVSTHMDKFVMTSSICLGCTIMIHGRTFKVDLICLPLSQLDVVLGIDWSLSNHVLLDCKEKVLIFSDGISKNPKLLSMSDQSNVTNAKSFMVLFSLEVEKSVKKENIPVVQEFPKVFPDDIVKLPLEREIEFAIDLIPRANPISIASYRMSPVELAEVKKQLEELLQK